MFDFSSSPLIARRTPGERSLRLFADLLLAWGIAFFVPLIVGIIPGAMATLVLGINGLSKLLGNAVASGMEGGAGTVDTEAVGKLTERIYATDGYRVAELFGEAWVIVVTLFVCLAICRRSLSTMGIEKKGAAKNYGFGLLVGVLLLSAVVLISCLSRASSFGGYRGNVNYLFLFFVLLGYVIQGAAEEILIHGLFLTSLFRHMRWLPSVLISAVLFSLFHVANDGVTVLSLLNVFLFGVLLGLFVIRTGSVIGAAALHTAWNFTEGHAFGCPVSGFPSENSLFTVSFDASRTVTNGGTFGLEGGLAATMVLMLALIAVLFLPSFGKKRRNTL